jgi:tRNA(Ile)-lysidine synthase
MLSSFLTFINQLGVDQRSKPILLTVSGGVDSVVMADLFYTAGFRASIAHCNFGLRGKDSEHDEVFVRNLAERYQFPFYVKHFETKFYAKQNGISTQMAARNLRYDWFEEIRQDKFDWIATAHHVNDALETVLLNLVRGTGIAGLHGIYPQKGHLLRPMLFASKDQILQYALENGLQWREDVSNDSVDYKRNLIRKSVIPVLRQLNPSLEETFKITSEKVNSADSLLTSWLSEWKNDIRIDESGKLRIPKAKLSETDNAAYLLWSAIEKSGFSYRQAKQIITSVDKKVGAVHSSATHQLLVERDFLIVRKKPDKDIPTELVIDGMGVYDLEGDRFRFMEVSTEVDAATDRDIIYLKPEKLKFPLHIRNWQHGDIFCPFGMQGKRKKVSDVLINGKISIYEKEKVRVLTDADGEILWLIGIRTDERQRVETGIHRLIRVEWQKAQVVP